MGKLEVNDVGSPTTMDEERLLSTNVDPATPKPFGLHPMGKLGVNDVDSPTTMDEERLLSPNPSTTKGGLHFSWRGNTRRSQHDRSNAIHLRTHHELALTLRKLVRYHVHSMPGQFLIKAR
jgi:hypothetical protein